MRKLIPLSQIVAKAEEQGDDLTQMLISQDDICTIDDGDFEEEKPAEENPMDSEE
jgi:hypothetical protein